MQTSDGNAVLRLNCVVTRIAGKYSLSASAATAVSATVAQRAARQSGVDSGRRPTAVISKATQAETSTVAASSGIGKRRHCAL